MSAPRGARAAERIRELLADAILREVRDPGLGFVTLTEVQLTPDLRIATVYVSVLGDERARRESLAALARAQPTLRRKVARGMRMRHVPELRFVEDLAVLRGSRVDELLGSLDADRPSGGDPEDRD